MEMAGQAYDLSIHKERNGWKEISFRIPCNVGDDENYRLNYTQNEYLVRVIRDDEEPDWFIIDEPKEVRSSKSAYLDVVCGHVSRSLNRKNLYGYFDDENGVGTISELMTKALYGTGWSLGECDILYEADGVTEKIRSYKCDEKTGAYTMIQELCELFMAYPEFHGDSMLVDIRARANTRGMIELVLGKNNKSIRRSKSSSDLVTKLYVEGNYEDDAYVGIDNVNPTGLPFILNFDYYKEVGMFTDEHQAIVDGYIADLAAVREGAMTASTRREDLMTKLIQLWGGDGYIFYDVANGTASMHSYANGATEEDVSFKNDDVLLVVKANGTYERIVGTDNMSFATDVVHVVKFLSYMGGTIGAKDVAIEVKESTAASLLEEIEKADSDRQKSDLAAQRNKTQEEIAQLKSEAQECIAEAITYVQQIAEDDAVVANAVARQNELDDAFARAMGDMLKEGTWTDSNYVEGQEEALYNDALEVAASMSRPIYTYDVAIVDLSDKEEYQYEEFLINRKLHIIDEVFGISDYGFVNATTTWPMSPWKNSIELSTDQLGLEMKNLDTLLSRILTQADIIKENRNIYERAKALNGEGMLYADRLDGEIDLLKNQLGSTVSGSYTDENGNWIFESADGASAMMLTGAGFMVASGKDDQGNWKWRTFGTGEGFTADMLTTGILKAGIITILGSDQFYWDADNIYIFNPENPDQQIRIGCYDGTNYGIGYTQDNGVTWQNAIGFNGVSFSVTDVTEAVLGSDEFKEMVGGEMSELRMDIDGISTRVQDAEGNITTLQQTAEGLIADIEDMEADTQSQFELLNGEISMRVTEGQLQNAIDSVQIGGANLLINSSLYRKSSPITATSSSTDYYEINSQMYMFCTPGETYTFQAVTDGIWGYHSSSGVNPATTHLFLYLQTADIPFENTGSYSTAVSLNASNQYWHKSGKCVWTYTIPTDKQYVRLRIRYDIHSDGSTPATVSWWDFKAERGNKATDWTPPSEDVDDDIGNLRGEISTLRSEINVTAEEVSILSNEVSKISVPSVGSTNLLRETGWYTEVTPTSVGWLKTYQAFTEYPYIDNPGADEAFPENGFIQWTARASAADCNTPTIKSAAGEIYTVSFRHRGQGLQVHILGKNAAGSQSWGPMKAFDNDTAADCSYTFTIPSDRDVSSFYVVFRATTGSSGVLGRIKLEKGNVATTWSPHPLDNVDRMTEMQSEIDVAAGGVDILSSRVNTIDGRVTSAETSLRLKADQATLTSTANGLQSQINAVPGQITAAVGGIQIGGTNLIRETGWYTEVAPTSAGWTRNGAFIYYPYDTNPGADDFYDNGFIHWVADGGGDLWTPNVLVKAGEVFTLRFRHRGANMRVIWWGANSSGTQIWSGSEKLYSNASTTDCTETLTIPANVVRIRIVFRTTSGEAGVLGRIKLERGNKATAWSPSPLDCSRGVINGSALNITPDAVTINTPVFGVNVSGTNGDMSISETGLSINQINSPSVHAQYNGPATLYVTGTANGTDTFVTLSDVFARLSNKHLPDVVTVNVNTSYTDGTGTLQNVTGADIVIHGHNNTITGAFDMNSVQSRVMIDNLHISYAAANPWDLFNCSYVYMQWCIITANRSVSQWVGGINVQNGTTLTLESCTVNNAYVAVNIYYGSRVSITNCKGSDNTYAFVVRYMSALGMRGYRPPGSILVDGDAWAGTDPGASSSDAPAAPEATTTVTLTATNSCTHDGGSWYSGTKVIAQGKTSDGGVYKGCIWFDRSAFVGKTIKSASIRLYRRAGVGKGSPVVVKIGSCMNTMPASGYNVVTKTEYADIIGTVDQKEWLEASIPVQAIQEIADQTAAGLYLWGSAANYAQFDGTDSANKPQLTVTYS